MKRVLVAGLQHESNSFNPIVTGEKDFQVIRGAEVFNRFRPNDPVSGVIKPLMEQGYEVVPTVFASAVPNGEVDHDFYMNLKAEIIRVAKEEQAKKPPQRERRIIRPRKGILAVRLPLRREVLRCAGRALQADALHLDTETVNHRRRARPRTIRALISALRPAAASWQPPEERFRLQPTVIRLEIMLWSTMEMDFQPCICTVPSFWYRQGIR